MKPFKDEHFLLKTKTAQKLFHEYAKEMPIIDYHCHLSAKEIAENKAFQDLSEIWLQGDHYKWRALRANGVEERFITGDATAKEKFDKWAATVPYTMGNPLFHWTALELDKYFGIDKILTPNTADEIWERCNNQLNTKQFTSRALIEKSNVHVICTTDDPIDDLQYHRSLKEEGYRVKVLPTFRPDGALGIELETFSQWIINLITVSGVNIISYKDFLIALKQRIQYFDELGCKLSDHGLDASFYHLFSAEEIEVIFQKGLKNDALTEKEVIQFKTSTLIELGKMYAEKGWAMQLHIGAIRNNNRRMLECVGQNTGYDSIHDFTYSADLSQFLDALDYTNELPKTIIYNLNPRDNYMIGSMIGNFQGGIPGKMQFGTAWWFGDQRDGMVEQIKVLANTGLLARFVGMLTDSRSFLSYTRHEYFRRILCDVIGEWVENGEFPADYELLGNIIKDICYFNIKNYLSLEI
ncbi:glucuronate isomerase [Lysinibacillus sp. 2017]|uniref:glucuronate isomerase n=1 Tax=unclassified Lysinibacillus TaxID=2636778 RepID=UPI000D525934|nr:MULTISPECIES: glucuronate isomerase [unclassified Lysinibacillus]AWE07249.1 glucuronate isomerase [Lysinibacillus sp. 2017]TGN33306.1 glucuronate isomerase [Lysinibacillus sp. S2017]